MESESLEGFIGLHGGNFIVCMEDIPFGWLGREIDSSITTLRTFISWYCAN